MIRKIFRILAFGIAGLFLLVVVLVGSWYKADIPAAKLESKYFTPESSYVDIQDARVHIRQRGIGPFVFLIHGSFASLHTWSPWEDQLSKSFTTLSMDLPGHGLTGPVPSKNYSTDDYEKLVMALADHLKVDTFYVAGNSMGGNVAWKMALHHPDRVKKIILVDAAGFGPLANHSERKRGGSVPFIFKMLQSEMLGSLLTRITPRFLVKINMEQVYGDPSKIKPEDIVRFYDLILREGNRTATFDRLRRQGRDLQDSIQYIRVPTLILWGGKDRWIPVEHAARFHDLIQNSEIKIYPTAGHIPMEELPTETVADAISFLKNQQPAPMD